jgi:hypothetical protein
MMEEELRNASTHYQNYIKCMANINKAKEKVVMYRKIKSRKFCKFVS